MFSSDNIVVSHYLGAAEVTPYSVTWRLVGLAAVLAVAHLSGALAGLRRGVCQARLWLDTAHLLPDHERHGRAQSVLRGCADCFWPRVDSRVGGSGGGADIFPVAGDGSVGADQRIHERRILFAGGAEPYAGTGILSIVAAVVNIALSIALVRHIGSLGVIGGTILSYLLVLVIPQSMIVRRLFKRIGGGEGDAVRFSLFAFRQSKIFLERVPRCEILMSLTRT